MQYVQRNFNFTVKNTLLLLTAFVISFEGFAQGPLGSDSTSKRVKIDGVSAVVGDYVILDSDIDKTLVDMRSQGIPTDGIERCQLLGKLMEDKLYAHHAVQDSLVISDSEVYSYVDQSIEYFTEELGSMEKVLEFYNKPDELSFREQLFEINKLQKLASLMQSEIVSKIEITPEEVRNFFDAIPIDELPVFSTEIELAQIVVEPKIKDEETQRVIERLEDFKNDVEEKGLSFASKAILYSQDPGSRSTGGKYTLHRKRPRMVKEFRDAAFRLEEGQISKPFKSDFGWHILTVDKIRGQQVDVRHILLTPKVAPDQLEESRVVLDSLRKHILNEEITFEVAAFNFSSEKETKNSGGTLINPVTGDTRFELTKMDPTLYNQVSKLEEGEISLPLLDEDRSGLKKYKIIKINNRFEEHMADYSKDFIRIKELALKDKQLRAIEKWTKEKIADTYVSISKDYKYCDFTNNWSKN